MTTRHKSLITKHALRACTPRSYVERSVVLFVYAGSTWGCTVAEATTGTAGDVLPKEAETERDAAGIVHVVLCKTA